MRLTLKTINNELAKRGYTARLANSTGYFCLGSSMVRPHEVIAPVDLALSDVPRLTCLAPQWRILAQGQILPPPLKYPLG